MNNNLLISIIGFTIVVFLGCLIYFVLKCLNKCDPTPTTKPTTKPPTNPTTKPPKKQDKK